MTSLRLLTPAARILLEAADYIETNGHCKHVYRVGNKACLLGAIDIVLEKEHAEPFRFHVVNAMEVYLGTVDVAYWNDAPARTAEEVIAALRSVALSLSTSEAK